MSPTLTQHDHVGGFWVDPKAASKTGAAFALGVTLAHLAHIILSQPAIAVAGSFLCRWFPKSKSKSMKRVFTLRTPLQIADMVVFWIAVFVVDKRQRIGIWQKRICHQTMHHAREFLTVFGKVYAQVVCSFARLGRLQFAKRLMTDAAICANQNAFWVRENTALFVNRIQALKAFDIFHKTPDLVRSTR